MRLTLVIVLPPAVNDCSHVNNITEPVLIQTLISKSTIKVFDKPVLYRLAWLNKPKLDAMLKGPRVWPVKF